MNNWVNGGGLLRWKILVKEYLGRFRFFMEILEMGIGK